MPLGGGKKPLTVLLQIDAFTSAVRADKYFVAGYFMRGYHQIALRGLGKALQDYDNAANFMRGNAVIDYTQLGLACKVYYAEIMFNRGMVQFLMNRQQQAFEDLAMVRHRIATTLATL